MLLCRKIQYHACEKSALFKDIQVLIQDKYIQVYKIVYEKYFKVAIHVVVEPSWNNSGHLCTVKKIVSA